jgi:sodium-dependent dicarboxylate transporter 2/3/5
MNSDLESVEHPVAVRRAGLLAGPLLALALYLLLPETFTGVSGDLQPLGPGARATLAVMGWMAVWWLTEAVDVAATALLPLALFPLFGILSMGEAAAPYASDLVFLFMGGFIIALAMQRWGLDRRIALATLRLVGPRPPAIIAGFMAATAVLSMWVSNTATTGVMLPIALSVIELLRRQSDPGAGLHGDGADGRNFAISLMLAVAYSASIGGIATIIGTPTNGILVQFMAKTYGREIGFAEWLAVGLPVTLLMLPTAWLLLTRVLFPVGVRTVEGGRGLFAREYVALGPMRHGEFATLLVFLGAATAWITRPWLADLTIGTGGSAWQPLAGLSDAGVAMTAALLLFVIPVREAAIASASRRVFVMDWPTAEKLPWGVLMLFGGGLSLAAAVQANGVAEFIGAQAGVLGGMPTIVVVLALTAGVIFLTELTSNAATVATLVPILAGLATGIGVPPEALLVPATIAASCAFMLPAATPPNAIVFGSGHLTIPQMARAGFWLNVAGIAIITGLTWAIFLPLLAAP